jgi:hypothetical protein
LPLAGYAIFFASIAFAAAISFRWAISPLIFHAFFLQRH